MLSGVTPLYMHLDPRLLATPEHTTPGARAFALLGPNYGWTVLWKDDAWDGATSLDEAIACAVSIALERGQQVKVECSPGGNVPDAERAKKGSLAYATVFTVGPEPLAAVGPEPLAARGRRSRSPA